MFHLDLKITVDRPQGIDTIIDQSGELTSSSINVIKTTLDSTIHLFDGEDSTTKFKIDSVLQDMDDVDETLIVQGSAKKSTLIALINLINEANQSPPIVVIPEPEQQ